MTPAERRELAATMYRAHAIDALTEGWHR